MKLKRRDFLASVFSLPSLFSTSSRAKKVLVLGAGLSGLASAYELALRGFEVKVIEARSRAGGRVFTLRKPFLEGQYAELGGELIGDGYKRLLDYARKFNIPFSDVNPEVETGGSVSTLQRGIGTSAIIKGKLYPVGSQLTENPYNLHASEASELPPFFLSKQVALLLNKVLKGESSIADYDNLSLANALRNLGVSEQMIRLIDISLNYNSIETVSTACVLWDSIRRQNAGTKAIKIIGGNELLIKAFQKNALKFGVGFIFGAEIKKIYQSLDSVTVTFIKDGKKDSLNADYVVCTLPFSVLKNVEFEPRLPEARINAIKSLQYTRITKVFLQAERSEWDKRNLGSSIWTDTACERIFNASGKRGEKLGIFTIWTEGNGASILEKMSETQRINWGKKNFCKLLPFMKNKIHREATKSWTLDKYARGAYAHFVVGQFTKLRPLIKQPFGRIHFAGEHTAENYPGMEGALESAERVVNEISI